jgi:hypothetical protein
MMENLITRTTKLVARIAEATRRAAVVVRVRFTVLRAAPDAGYSTEFWVVTGTVVAVALTALGIWAADVLTAAHNVQLTTNTAGS